ncbi:MAG: aspartate aminotransferase family protein [Nitratireductor sp.]
MSEQEHTFPNYGYPQLEFSKGEGVRLFATNGDDYIDLSSGIAVNSLGHAHPHLVAALKEQAEKLWHTSNLFKVQGQERLAKRLCENSFADNVFFTNSGAEALECAIKTARRFHYSNGNEKRINVITFEGAFHGRTLGTIAAGGQAKYLEGFGPKAPGFLQVPFADHEALKAAIDDETAAILVEPIQGEGGINEIPPQCLQGLRSLCDEHGILLIYDEVQSGIGRTGKLFAHEWANKSDSTYEAAPHIMALAKGLGGGFPMGACLAEAHVASVMAPGTHGSTFAGNPLAMAVGNAVLDVVLEEGFLESVRSNGVVLSQLLAEITDSYPDLFELVRGKGLLMGIRSKVPNAEIVQALRDGGVLSVPAGDNIIRMLPPLTITHDELREAKNRMTKGLDAYVEKTK